MAQIGAHQGLRRVVQRSMSDEQLREARLERGVVAPEDAALRPRQHLEQRTLDLVRRRAHAQSQETSAGELVAALVEAPGVEAVTPPVERFDYEVGADLAHELDGRELLLQAARGERFQ